AIGDDRSGGAIIAGAVDPVLLAGLGIDAVELIAAEAAANKHLTINHGRSGQRPVARDNHLPALFAFLGGEFDQAGDVAKGTTERAPAHWSRLDPKAASGTTDRATEAAIGRAGVRRENVHRLTIGWHLEVDCGRHLRLLNLRCGLVDLLGGAIAKHGQRS